MTPARGTGRGLVVSLIAAVTAACSTNSHPSLEPLHQSTVLVEHAHGHGTGAIVGPDRVLTADHVIEAEPLEITFLNRETAPAEVVWRDPKHDIALLDVDVPDGYQPSAVFCGGLVPGQHLILIGHPTHSRWVAVGGHLPGDEPFEGDLVLLGFPIGLGSSGGPVFDDGGRIVGVALAILAERSSETANFGEQFRDTGIGLMLPSKVFCDELAVE